MQTLLDITIIRHAQCLERGEGQIEGAKEGEREKLRIRKRKPYLLISIFYTASLKINSLLYSKSVSFTRPQGDLFQFEQAENVLKLTE
jgi:hypothetical protein